MEIKSSKKRRRWPAVLLIAVVSLLAVVWLAGRYANKIAKDRLSRQILEAIGIDVRIESATLGTNQVVGKNIVFGDPNNPLMVADRLIVEAPLSELLRRVPELQTIRIERPTVTLALSRDGKLNWPSARRQRMDLPADRIQVIDAAVVITQPGHDDLTIQGADLNLQKQDTMFQVSGSVGATQGPAWQIEGLVDPAGKSRLVATSAAWRFSTDNLAQLPMAPVWTGQIDASGIADVRLELNWQDASSLAANVKLQNASLDISSVDVQLTEASADILFEKNGIEIQIETASLGHGNVSGHAEMKLETAQAKQSGIYRLAVNQVSAEGIRSLASIPNSVSGTATGELFGGFSMSQTGIDLDLRGTAIVNDAKYHNLAIDPCEAELKIEKLAVHYNKPVVVLGTLDLGGIQAKDVPLQLLADLVASPRIELGSTITGSLSGTGRLSIPLGSAFDQSKWTAMVAVTSDSMRVKGLQLSGTTAQLALTDGNLSIRNVRANVKGRPENMGGSLAFRGSFDAPLSTASNLATWVGTLEVASPEFSWQDIVLNDIAMNGSLAQGVVDFTEIRSRIGPAGTVLAKARLPLVGQQRVSIAFDVQQMPIIDLGKVLSMSDEHVTRWMTTQRTRRPEMPLLAGLANIQGRLAFNASDVSDPNNWQADLTLSSSNFSLLSTVFSRVQIEMGYNDGVINNSRIACGFAAGGEFHAALVVPSDMRAQGEVIKSNAAWTDLPLELLSDCGLISTKLKGTTSGKFDSSVASSDLWNGELSNIEAISGAGLVELHGLSFGGLVVDKVGSNVVLRDAHLVLESVRVEAEPIGGSLSFGLQAPYTYEANVVAKDLGVLHLLQQTNKSKGFPNLDGKLSVKAQVVGNLSHGHLDIRGDLAARSLRIGEHELPDLQARFENLKDQLRIRGQIFNGSFDLNADLPGSGSRSRELNLHLTEVALEEIIRAFPFGGRDKPSIAGRVDVELNISAWADPQLRDARLWIRGSSVECFDIALTELAANIRVARKSATYRVTGRTLSGEISLNGKTPLNSSGLPSVIPVKLRMQKLRLDQLHGESPRFSTLQPLAGELDVDLDINMEAPNYFPLGEGSVPRPQSTLGSSSCICDHYSALTLVSNRVRFYELRADFGNGTVSGNIEVPFDPGQNGSYQLVARRVDLPAILKFTSPMVNKERIAGSVHAYLSGRLGRQISGVGKIEMGHLTWRRTTITKLRAPLTYEIDPATWSGRVDSDKARIRFAGGHIVSRASVDFGQRLNFALDAKLSKVDVSKLVGDFSRFGQGQLTGSLNLKGQSVRSIRDVKGRFRGRLENSRSFQLPVLSDITKFASVGQLSQASFASSEMDIRLANGVLSTPGLVLQSDQAELFVQGKAHLNRRLDLEIAMQTGNINPGFGANRLVDGAVTRFALPGASVFHQVADHLSNRVIYFHVGGTVRSPHFRLRTDRLIQQELLRHYFPDANLAELGPAR